LEYFLLEPIQHRPLLAPSWVISAFSGKVGRLSRVEKYDNARSWSRLLKQ